MTGGGRRASHLHQFSTPFLVTFYTATRNIMDSAPILLYLPDTMGHWPVERAVNPHRKEVEAQYNAWFSKYMPHVKDLGLDCTMRKSATDTTDSFAPGRSFMLLIIFHSSYGFPWFPHWIERWVAHSVQPPRMMIQRDISQNYYSLARNLRAFDSCSKRLRTVSPHPSFVIP